MSDHTDSELPEKSKKEDNDGKEPKADMPFLDHVEELRWRIIKSILAVVVMGLISFAFAGHIYKFATMPLGDVKLHFTEVTGSFYAYLKISFYTGIFGALPIVFYQLWKFIAPGLYKTEKQYVLPMVAASTILFLIGASFCFFKPTKRKEQER